MESSELGSAVSRMLKALSHRVGEEDPASLRQLTRIEAGLILAWRQAIDELRDNGHTDREIAEVLGTTRQNVRQRWPHRTPRIGAAARYPTVVERPGNP